MLGNIKQTKWLVIIGIVIQAMKLIPALSKYAELLANITPDQWNGIANGITVIVGLLAVNTAKNGVHKHIEEATDVQYSKDAKKEIPDYTHGPTE